MKYDVVIIGSGLGGLACGRILSEAGERVLVLESGTQAGGCLQSYKRKGFAFDTGFHYVGGLDEGQSLHAAFRLFGLLSLPWKRLDAEFDRVTIDGRTFAFAQGFDAFTRRLTEDFPEESDALRRYARLLQQMSVQQWDALNPHNNEPFASSPLFDQNAYQYLTETFRNPLLVQVLSGTSLKTELRRESLPLFSFLHGNSSFVESSWRLAGDSSLLVQALTDGIRANGGEVVCRARVTELVDRGGKLAYAVCSNGERYEADLFISDIHPAQTCDLLKDELLLKKSYRNRMHRLANTFGMFTVSLLLKPGSVEYFNWNHYVYPKHADVWALPSEKGTVDGLLVSCRAPETGERYARQIDLLTPMNWELCERWIHTQVGKRGADYEAMKQRLVDACITLAEEVVPGLRGQVEACYTSTPLTYRDYTLTPDGSAYGVRKDCNAPLATWLSPRTPVPNLFLTGQNLMLHGVHGVTMTALFTCAEILGKEKMWNMIQATI